MVHLIQKADTPNLNGRVYPKETLKEIVDNFDQEHHPVFGIIGYGGYGEFCYELDMAHVSHQIEDLFLDDCGNLMGKIKILDTPNGVLLESLNEACPIVFRMAGYANTTIDSNGTTIVHDFKLTYVAAIHKDEAA